MLEYLAKLATVLQGLAIPIAIIFGLLQWTQQNDLAKAANSQQLVAQAADFNFKLIDSEQNIKAWYSFGHFTSPEPFQRERYRELLVQWLIFHENIYNQNKKGLLDDDVYKSWDADLRFTMSHHNISMLGESIEELFPSEYGKYLIQLTQKKSR